MAKIKLSALGITNLSGKAGGSIFSRNRGGAYVKNFAIPTNPNTSFQQSVRQLFAGVAEGWRNLTDEQRRSWEEQKENYPQKDVFGDTRIPSAFELYQKLNSNLSLNEQSKISVAVPPQGVPALVLTDLTASVLDGTLTLIVEHDVIDNGAEVSNFVFVQEATAPRSASVSFVKNKFRSIGTGALTAFGSGTTGLGVKYENRFYAPLVGQAVSVKLRLLNLSTGELSTGVTITAIVEQGV